MSYTVIIKQDLSGDGIDTPAEKEVFRQTVEALDIRAVFAVVNKKPRKPRVSKAQQQVAQ